jgi:hypothetical protein
VVPPLPFLFLFGCCFLIKRLFLLFAHVRSCHMTRDLVRFIMSPTHSCTLTSDLLSERVLGLWGFYNCQRMDTNANYEMSNLNELYVTASPQNKCALCVDRVRDSLSV